MTPTQINHTNVAQEWAIEAAKKRTPKDAEVPEEYRCHAVVFSETAAHRFPPSQPEDHAIQLKPDTPDMIKCKTYLLTKPVTIARTCDHACVHLALLRICNTRALDAPDRDALTARSTYYL
jgi:hypothetical protein